MFQSDIWKVSLAVKKTCLTYMWPIQDLGSLKKINVHVFEKNLIDQKSSVDIHVKLF